MAGCFGCFSGVSKVTLPGRLGDPKMSPETDPRTHPGSVAALKLCGVTGLSLEMPPVPLENSLEARVAWAGKLEAAFGGMSDDLCATFPSAPDVIESTYVINGVDGNAIKLVVNKPTRGSGYPCVMYLHGGGMAVNTVDDAYIKYWGKALAGAGMISVAVDFRNAAGRNGPHPFPAGLNDCYAALRWCHEHKSRLGYSKLILNGEGGGGNLVIATSLKAKNEGGLNMIAGVYAMCPYICPYISLDLPSSSENRGYYVGVEMKGLLGSIYDPPMKGERKQNPLAWPYHAENSDLEGLPPCVISVNELDPMRDEGLTFSRKLAKAGVKASSVTVGGTLHAHDMMLFGTAPEISRMTLRRIKDFADSV